MNQENCKQNQSTDDEITKAGSLEEDFEDLPLDNQTITQQSLVGEDQAGLRLDKFASLSFDGFSRANLQKFIEGGQLLVNGNQVKPKYAVKAGDLISLSYQPVSHSQDLPEDIPLDILYEDHEVLVVNKPAGLVVHPGAGNRTGTLVNALLYHDPQLSQLPRAGLVHRIDKDTTGLLVVAKTKNAQLDLIDQLKDKSVYRHYQCIAMGAPHQILRHAHIDLPIGRHSTHRTKMAVRDSGKAAVTHIVNAKSLHENYSLLDVQLETGRTHQIRVHLSHLGHPLVGDRVYGTSARAGLSPEQRAAVMGFPRQALHAYTLGFMHPKTKKPMKFQAPMPDDMQDLIQVLSQ